jgi:TnpA family transposase
LGFSLEPRIRDIGEMRLFRMCHNVDQFQHIRALFSAPINTRAIRENWDDVLRLMASIYIGVVPAFRVLSKLNAYQGEPILTVQSGTAVYPVTPLTRARLDMILVRAGADLPS